MTFKVAVVEFDADTGGGTQDITGPSGFGTPVAAKFIVSRATADNSTTNGLSWGVGFTDGTRQCHASAASEHGGASSDTYRWMQDDACILVMDPVNGLSDGEAHFDSWITDGVRIDWATTPTSAYKCIAILYGGTDCSAYVGSFNCFSGTDNITAPGFEPDWVEFATTRSSLTGTSASTTGSMSYGIAVNTSGNPQHSINCAEADGTGTTEAAVYHQDGVIARNLSQSASFGGGVATDFDSSGFSVAQSSGGISGYYLAITWGSNATAACAIDRVKVPGSTGTVNYTELGDQADVVFVAQAGTQSTEWDALQTSGVGVISMGLGAFVPGGDQALITIATHDGAGTTDTEVRKETTKTLRLTDNQGGTLAEGDSSTNASGFTIDWTSVGDDYDWFYLAIKVDEGSGAQTVTPSGFAPGPNFGSPTLSPGNVNISPSAFAPSPAFGSPSVSSGTSVSPSGFAPSPAFGTPTLSPGNVNVSPSGFGPSPQFGSCSIDQVVSPTGFAVSPAFGSPNPIASINPSGLSVAPAFGSPSFAFGNVNVGITAFAPSPAFGSPTVTAATDDIEPTGFAVSPAFGTPTIVPGNTTVMVGDGVGFSAALSPRPLFGTPTILGGRAFQKELTVTAGAIAATGTQVTFPFSEGELSAGQAVEIIDDDTGDQTFGWLKAHGAQWSDNTYTLGTIYFDASTLSEGDYFVRPTATTPTFSQVNTKSPPPMQIQVQNTEDNQSAVTQSWGSGDWSAVTTEALEWSQPFIQCYTLFADVQGVKLRCYYFQFSATGQYLIQLRATFSDQTSTALFTKIIKWEILASADWSARTLYSIGQSNINYENLFIDNGRSLTFEEGTIYYLIAYQEWRRHGVHPASTFVEPLNDSTTDMAFDVALQKDNITRDQTRRTALFTGGGADSTPWASTGQQPYARGGGDQPDFGHSFNVTALITLYSGDETLIPGLQWAVQEYHLRQTHNHETNGTITLCWDYPTPADRTLHRDLFFFERGVPFQTSADKLGKTDPSKAGYRGDNQRRWRPPVPTHVSNNLVHLLAQVCHSPLHQEEVVFGGESVMAQLILPRTSTGWESRKTDQYQVTTGTGRAVGRTLFALLDAYHLTGDDSYRNRAVEWVRDVVKPATDSRKYITLKRGSNPRPPLEFPWVFNGSWDGMAVFAIWSWARYLRLVRGETANATMMGDVAFRVANYYVNEIDGWRKVNGRWEVLYWAENVGKTPGSRPDGFYNGFIWGHAMLAPLLERGDARATTIYNDLKAQRTTGGIPLRGRGNPSRFFEEWQRWMPFPDFTLTTVPEVEMSGAQLSLTPGQHTVAYAETTLAMHDTDASALEMAFTPGEHSVDLQVATETTQAATLEFTLGQHFVATTNPLDPFYEICGGTIIRDTEELATTIYPQCPMQKISTDWKMGSCETKYLTFTVLDALSGSPVDVSGATITGLIQSSMTDETYQTRISGGDITVSGGGSNIIKMKVTGASAFASIPESDYTEFDSTNNPGEVTKRMYVHVKIELASDPSLHWNWLDVQYCPPDSISGEQEGSLKALTTTLYTATSAVS